MSLEKELKKAGEKIKNVVGEDKDERAQDCFNTVKSAKGAICDINTKQEVAAPKVGIGRIDPREGNKLEYCLNELKKQGEAPCNELPAIEKTKEKQTKALSELEKFKSIDCKDNAKIADNMVKFFKINQEGSLNKVSWDANKIIQIETALQNKNFNPTAFDLNWTQECKTMKDVAVQACKELHPDNTNYCQSHDEL